MSSPRLRRGCAALTSIALAGSIALLVPASADAAPTAKRNFGGSAYGSAARVGNEVNLGRTASQPLCTVRPGVTRTNNTAASDLDELGSIGAQVTKVESKQSGSTQSSTTTTTTAGVRLLNGVADVPVVTADSVKTVAKVIFRDGRYERQASTTFVRLRVNNVLVADQTPAPNTEIEIPGLGRVILNAQSSTDSFKIHAQTVNGLRLIVDSTTLGRGLVSVAYAQASLSSPTFARAFGNAYATQVQAGDVVRSGATANVYLPCGGSNGATRTNNVADVGPVQDLLATGAATTTARSTDSASAGTNATTTARIAGVNLLGGTVTADAVTAKASTTRKGSSVVRTSAGTTITDLEINGENVAVGSGSNQRIQIAGLGDLYVRRVITDSSGLQVYALQLVVRSASSGLPVGTTINVGAAKAGVTTTN